MIILLVMGFHAFEWVALHRWKNAKGGRKFGLGLGLRSGLP